MSVQTTIDVTCPKCKRPGQMGYWQSVNVAQNPELRETLLAGKLNVYTCPSCEGVFPVAGPLLYHDMAGKTMVRVAREPIDEPVPEMPVPEVKEAIASYRLREVEDITALVELVNVRNDGLDERVVHAARLLAGAGSKTGKGRLLAAGITEQNGVRLLVFTRPAEPNAPPVGIRYDDLARDLGPHLGPDTGAEWVRLDANYATAVIQRAQAAAKP